MNTSIQLAVESPADVPASETSPNFGHPYFCLPSDPPSEVESQPIKLHPKLTHPVFAQSLMLGVGLIFIGGCAGVDSKNADTRPWGRPSAYEQRQQLRGPFDGVFFTCPQWEQQRNEDWLRSR
jgi:hypothetical protein